MNDAQTLSGHYGKMLSLTDPWLVLKTELDTEKLSLKIHIYVPKGTKLPCPVCGKLCSKEDHREERVWRHLDTMQFKTSIVCRLPRVNCPEHGVLSAKAPWAGNYSRFTLLFEHFAIDVLKAARSIKSAKELLRLSWDQVQEIQRRAVERGLERRRDEPIKHLGIDEKNFLKRHSYASILTDIDRGRVLEVAPDRTEESAKKLFETLSENQKKNVEAAAMDMWPAFMNGFESVFPEADIVHDKYHVACYLGKAVDAVRKKEHNSLSKTGDDALKGTKYLWLSNPDNLTKEAKKTFRTFALDEMKVGRAWSIKEAFRRLWDYHYLQAANNFFKQWYFWATHSRLKPIIETAKTLKRHLKGIINYLKHHITNAAAEGLNSKIQSLKSNARGFRNFSNYRTAILFHCGKLNLYP